MLPSCVVVRNGNISPTCYFEECGRARALRLFLRFWPREIILGCFQTGRTSQWAQAHFFVGRDGWRDAGASMPGVPAVAGRVGRDAGSLSQDSTGTHRRVGFEAAGLAEYFQADRRNEAKYRCWNRMQLEKVREAAERVAGSLGLEIFDIEWKVGKQRMLRVYIDRLPGPLNPEGLGVTHKDCERVSEQLSVILDIEDLVPGPAYILEVSSPGLDRKLIRPADYERFVGRLAKIWLNEPLEKQAYFEGRLAGITDGMVKFTVRDREIAVPYAGIKKANLVVEL